ncbi:MAG: hypothetical protein RL347_601, partial [Actinomycetota bacterium]
MTDEEQPSGSAGRRGLLVTLAVVAGALVFYLGMVMGASSDIPANTTVLGVQIGGMSRAEAVATLEESISPRATEPISVGAFGTSEEILPEDAGMSF